MIKAASGDPAPMCVIRRGQPRLLTASPTSQAGWGDTGSQDPSAEDNPWRQSWQGREGAALDGEDFLLLQRLVQPQEAMQPWWVSPARSVLRELAIPVTVLPPGPGLGSRRNPPIPALRERRARE